MVNLNSLSITTVQPQIAQYNLRPQPAHSIRIYDKHHQCTYHRVNKGPSTDKEPLSSHDFIQKVTDKFKGQRLNCHFSVLFLSPKAPIEAALMDIKENILDCSYQTTDKTTPTFPANKNLCDYITARPDGLIHASHAEKLIMDKFFVLTTAYRNKMPLFRSILGSFPAVSAQE